MRRILAAIVSASLLSPLAHAEDAPAAPAPKPEPTAHVTRGARMKLEPPKPSILESEDPLFDLTNRMTDVVGELADLKTGHPVQHKQSDIVSDLDQLIAMLEKQKSGNGNGGSRNPTKPMNRSQIAGGPGGMGDLINPKSGTRNFGNLPPKERQQILQSKTEGFPAGYESLLQSYYQRLAQEKTGGDEAAAPAPTTKPAK